MLLYDKRRELADKFEEWREDRNYLDYPFNVITFLEINNLFDEEKVLTYLSREKMEDK